MKAFKTGSKITVNTFIKGTESFFYSVFLIMFFIITLQVILIDDKYHLDRHVIIVWVLALAAAIFLLLFLLNKAWRFAAQYDKYWLPVILIAFFAVQIYTGRILRFESAFDFEAIYKGAVSWVENGTFTKYYDYFDWFPNNLGAMTLLYMAFKTANIFGVTDFFTVGVVLNSALVTLTILFSYLAAKKAAPDSPSVRMAVLIFFIITAPFYIMGAAFYTDSLSMLFPVLFYYFYLCLKTSDKKRLYLFLAGIVMAIGTIIKATVIIMAIAVIIDSIFDKKIKRAICVFISVSICLVTAQYSLNTYMYTKHLDPVLAEQKNTPIGHWIMMGLNFDSKGAYHPKDYQFTRSFKDTEERDRAIAEEIKKRLTEREPDELKQLFMTKLQKAYGDGTFALSDFLDDKPHNEGKLHSYVLYSGENYKTYKYMTQIPLITSYIFMCIGALRCIIESILYGEMKVLAPFTAIFGLTIFLAFWESSSRYFLNFVPIIYICGSFAVYRRNKNGIWYFRRTLRHSD